MNFINCNIKIIFISTVLLLLLSCTVDSEKIVNKRILQTLNISLNMTHEIIEFEQNASIFGGGDYSENCEIKFTSESFIEFLSILDTTQWQKFDNKLFNAEQVEFDNGGFNWFQYKIYLDNNTIECKWGFE